MTENPPSRLEQLSARTHALERRNTRSFVMLDVRLRSGDQLAVPYAYLVAIELLLEGRPSPTLILTFTSHVIEVVGRNLQAVYESLLTHACDRLAEAESEHDTGETPIFIERISVRRQA